MKFRRVLSYYWRQARKYPKSGIAVFVLYSLGSVLAYTVVPIFYKEIIDVVSTNEARTADVASQLIILLLWIGGTIALYNSLFRAADYCIAYFQSKVLFELSEYTLLGIQKHSYSFFANTFSGSIVTKAKRFVWAFSTIHSRITFSFVFHGVQVIGAVVVMFLVAPILAIFYLAWIFLYAMIVAFFIKKKLPYNLIEANADSLVTARYADIIGNILTIKLFSMGSSERRSFTVLTSQQEKKRRKAWNVENIQILIQGALFGLLEIGLVSGSVWLWFHNEITVGTVVLLQIYVIGTFNAIWDFGRALSDMAKALADAQEMVEIFEQQPSVKDPIDPEKCRIKEGDIEFRDVSFFYEKGNKKVFENFNLSIRSGEKVGLVGHSGAGKTTITKILLRFADISDGSVLIDDQDIRHIRQDDLRSAVSYVPQETILFHRTLRENIAYGKPNATDKEIVAVAKKAHAHEFIDKLPKGYDTLVGERGIKLSGGERQRVAIARAILKDAPILVLDEATSSLDSMSEQYIQEALAELMKEKTTIVIAHRLSTIQKMDRILVVENGKIVEEGKHNALVEKNGVYAMFWKQQAGGFIGD